MRSFIGWRRLGCFVVLLVGFLVIGVGCSSGNGGSGGDQLATEAKIEERSQTSTSVVETTDSIYLQDMTGLIETLEDTHPAFALEDLPTNYEAEKNSILEAVKETSDPNEFRFLVMRYLTLMRDGHTKVADFEPQNFIDLDLDYIDNHLFVLDENGKPTDKEITHIGGKPILDLLESMDAIFAAENDAAKKVNYRHYLLSDFVIKYAGCQMKGQTVDLTFEANGVTTSENLSFITKDLSKVYQYNNEISSRIIDDVYYIDMNTCNDNEVLAQEIKKLKQAIGEGINKIIIDVRNNGGGNSMACTKLLEAMDMRSAQFGYFTKYSNLAHSKFKDIPIEGYREGDPDLTQSKGNSKIKLVVLTNEYSFSGATMLGAMVQDSNLGTLIGTVSSNSPSMYADILYYTLPKTKIFTIISFKRFLRPDEKANQRELVPDILTGSNEDSLPVALEFLGRK